MKSGSMVRSGLFSVAVLSLLPIGQVFAQAKITGLEDYYEARDSALDELIEKKEDILNQEWSKAKEQIDKMEFDKKGGKLERTPIKETADDLAVPDVPAITVLDVTPETVVRPSSPRQLVVGVLEGLDPSGELQTGLAFETSPYLLLGGNEETTIGEYNDSYGVRLLSGTGLSLATAKGTTDDEAVRLAAGLTLTLWDRGDPRLKSGHGLPTCLVNGLKRLTSENQEFNQELNKRMGQAFSPFDENAKRIVEEEVSDATKSENLQEQIQLGKLAAEAVQFEDLLPEHEITAAPVKVKACRDAHEEASWNASAWNFGLAPTWISPSGDVGDLEWSGMAIYSSLAYGFEEIPMLRDTAQLIVHGRYRMDEEAPLPDMPNTFVEQDSLTLSGQLRIIGFDISRFDKKGGSDLNFLGEVAHIQNWRDDASDEAIWRYTLGAEYRLTESLYLKASVGTQDGESESSDESFMLFNLKWNLSETPSFGR